MATRKIVLFKASEQEPDEYVELFRRNHLEVFSLSPIKFEFKELDTLSAKLNDDFRSHYSSLVITSPRILQALKQLVADQKLTTACLRSIPCITVGPQTYRRLLDEFGISSLIDNGLLNINNAKELADHLKANQDELAKLIDVHKPLLYPTSDLSKEELKVQLVDTAFRVEKLVCYETLPNDHLDVELDSILQQSTTEQIDQTAGATDKKADPYENQLLFVFFSPSGVKSVQQTVKCIGRLQKIPAVAIGPTTKKAIEEHKLNLVATASRPTPECLLETVLAFLGE